MKHKSADVGISKRIAHAIEGLRECEGSKMSLRFMATMIGIPYRSLQDYINGVRLPGAEALQKLAKYGININWVLLGDEEINFECYTDKAPHDDEVYDEFGSEAHDLVSAISPWLNVHRDKFVNEINNKFISKYGHSLPFLILSEINTHYVSAIVSAYSKARDLIPSLADSEAQINDILNVIEATLRDTLRSEVKDIISNSVTLDCVPSAETGESSDPKKEALSWVGKSRA
ncbi:MAG: helix-turn-helix transcriptional regulator [Rhodospirillaceae bacterium]